MLEQLVQGRNGQAHDCRRGHRDLLNQVVRVPFLILLLMSFVASASASHFRFGHLSWQRAGGQQASNTVEITVVEAWRAGTFGVGDITYTFDYNNESFTTAGATQIGTLTDITGEQYELHRRIITHTFPSNGVYTVASAPTFRLNTLENAPVSQATLKLVLDIRPGNTGTPATLSPVILQLPIDSTNSVAIPLVDPDGDPFSVRMASIAESGIPTIATIGTNQLTVTTNGVLNWNTTGGAVSNRYAIQLAIEENHPGFTTTGHVPLEFIIELISVAANERPNCTGPVGAQTAAVGTPFQATVSASDPEGQPLTVTAQQLPPGAVVNPTDGSSINSGGNVDIEWVPGEAQLGQSFSIVLVFTDNGGLQTNCSFTVSVSSQLPLPPFGSVTPSVSTTNTTAAGASANPAISEFGRYVVFSSAAADLTSGDSNGKLDVFRRDRARGTTELISVTSGGTSGNGDSVNPVVSPDGRFVAFQSGAANLVAGDSNGKLDVFVRDTLRGQTILVSSRQNTTTSGSGYSFSPVFAGNSNVVFTSTADDLTASDTNGTSDVFVRNLNSGTTTLVSVSTNGTSGNGPSSSPVVSTNGRYIAFNSRASDLAANDNNNATDVFVRDRLNPRCTAVSVTPTGATGSGVSLDPAIALNRDLVFVAFASQATDLTDTPDTNQRLDVFVREITTGTNLLVSHNHTKTATGNKGSSTPVFSPDGRGLLFVSTATDIAANDTNGKQDIFLWRLLDPPTGSAPPLPGTIPDQALELISVNSGGTATGNDGSGVTAASMSTDLRYVAFVSAANDLTIGGADTNNYSDVYVRDRAAGVTRLISYHPNNHLVGNGNSYAPFITANGGVIVFATEAANLAINDNNAATDIVAISTTNTLPSSLSAAVHITAPASSPTGIEFPVTLQAANLSAQGLNTLRLTNFIASSLTSRPVSVSHGSYDPETGIWTLGNLAEQEVASLHLRVSGNTEGPARLAAGIVPPIPFAPVVGRPSHHVSVAIGAPLQVEFVGPLTHNDISDSPWSASIAAGQTQVEEFEDVTLSAAITIHTGSIGTGPTGHGVANANGREGITITFNPGHLGNHPEQVGVVWTGGSGELTFEAWESEGRSLGQHGPFDIASAGNSFIGISSPHGISKIRVWTTAGEIEIDDLQFTVHSGFEVPDGLALWAKGDSGSRTAPGKIGGAYESNDSVGGVTISNPVSGNLSSAAVEFWFRPDLELNESSPWTPVAIMSPDGADFLSAAHGFDIHYSGGSLWFTAAITEGSTSSALAHEINFTADSWHHIVGIVEGSEQRLYVDGRQVAVRSLNGPVRFTGAPAQLGQGWLSGVAQFFDGAIDEYSLYRNSLTDTQISALFRESTRGKVRPELTVKRSGPLVVLEWPAFFTGYEVQIAAHINQGSRWIDLGAAPDQRDGYWRITLASNPIVPYYRLVRRHTNAPTNSQR